MDALDRPPKSWPVRRAARMNAPDRPPQFWPVRRAALGGSLGPGGSRWVVRPIFTDLPAASCDRLRGCGSCPVCRWANRTRSPKERDLGWLTHEIRGRSPKVSRKLRSCAPPRLIGPWHARTSQPRHRRRRRAGTRPHPEGPPAWLPATSPGRSATGHAWRARIKGRCKSAYGNPASASFRVTAAAGGGLVEHFDPQIDRTRGAPDAYRRIAILPTNARPRRSSIAPRCAQ